MESFVRGLPKAELHVHLEGCLTPELMFALAQRNGIALRWPSPEALRAAYRFTGLASFLELYFEGCRVLRTEQDFYDLTADYLRRAHADGVWRAEMFLGPQSFTERGIEISTIMQGVRRAIRDAEAACGISSALLVSAHRHRSEADALALLDSILPWMDDIAGIGMGGAECGNPPLKFRSFFRACRDLGFRLTIHAGEEGPADYVRQALDVLQVDRIDHGIACMSDPSLVRDLARHGIPLTVCPLSNLRLQVVASPFAHPLPAMLERGLAVSVHSDDPPYFDGYIAANYELCSQELGLAPADLVRLARNSFAGAFIPAGEKAKAIAAIDEFARSRTEPELR